MRTRKLIIGAICSLALTLGTGCENYLDKSPDLGLSTEDIYANFEAYRGYFDVTYKYLDNIYEWGQTKNARTHTGAFSDEMASLYNASEANNVAGGNWLAKNITGYEVGNGADNANDNTKNWNQATSIFRAYKMIRVSTRTIDDIDNVLVITDEQKTQLLGQAHMMRAWAYFQLIKRYGGMPIFDKVFAGNGDEDLPRQTYQGSHDWMMTDIEKAIAMLPEEWTDAEVGRANKMAALAFKAEALLYAASPLMQNGLDATTVQDYNKDKALLAAQAAQAVIDKVDASSIYALTPTAEYKNIFYFTAPPFTHPEYLWYNRLHEQAERTIRSYYLPSELAKGTGNDAAAYNCPTQNAVEMYERKGDDGNYYPLSDPRSGYTADVALNDPFSNRDPRFDNNIIYPGQYWGVDGANKAIQITTFKGGQMANTVLSNKETNKRQQTGYMCKKFMWETCNQWQNEYSLYRVINYYFRVGQMYLNYAEAAFEATGSATTVPAGCTLTAEQAVNIVRARAGVTPVPSDYVADPTLFREAYRRERAVELMFENFRWWDLRRWMTAHEVFAGYKPVGMESANAAAVWNIEAVKVSDGVFTYTPVPNTVEVRNFEMRNYWYPFSLDDVAAMKNLKQNPGW